MKTALEIAEFISSNGMAADKLIKQYAAEVAKKALSKAAQRLHISYISQELTPKEETEIIISTPIQTP